MDRRGQGESSIDWPEYTDAALGSDMLALIKQRGISPAFLIGASKATGAALQASLQEPSLVRGLVLIGPFVAAPRSALLTKLTVFLLLAPLWGVAVFSSYFPRMYPKALACYGMLEAESGRMHLRFVSGRPVSQVTVDFLEWLCEQVQTQGKRVLVLIWDNASWHVSKQVKTWLREHNQTVLQEVRTGKRGMRIIPCWLPTKSPWLNRIEPKWVHGKRAVVEPARLLSAQEVKQRVCDYFGCEWLSLLCSRFLEPALSASKQHSWQ